MIVFRIDSRSAIPPYLQIVQQVKHALRLGMIGPGDQLPTIKQVVADVAINPNTVLKAYRDLERDGLVKGRAGVGTFVVKRPDGPPPPLLAQLRRSLDRWLRSAFDAGLDHESIASLFESGLRDAISEEETA
jgi:DNA-binding transcriptional regulator YhcF (GntR family)